MADADPQTRRYQYRGELGQNGLPEMLYTVYLHRVPGVVECSRGEVLKRVFLRDGAVIHASSTDRQDSLGSFLQRTGRISDEQFTRTDRLRADSPDKRLGELLIEQGILSPAKLYEGIQEQIRSVVWSLFAWEEGEVAFSIGDFEESDMVRIYLPMKQVILQGVKRAPDAKALVSRLGRKETQFEPGFRTEDLIEVAMEEPELELLRLVDGKRTLYEVCTQGPFSPAENARIIYAFHVLRLIRRRVAERSGVVRLRLRTEPAGSG